MLGRLVPGERLKLDRLKARYSAGISTLREILSRLSSEDLVVAEGQRGFQVAPISIEELKEIGSLRLLLEQHALEQSFAAGDLDWEARVVGAHHKLASTEATLAPGSSGPMLGKRYDSDFHQALVSACGSRALLRTLANVHDRFMRYLMVALVFRGEIAIEEHKLLLQSALKRDVPTAKRTLARHIEGAVDSALSSDRFAG